MPQATHESGGISDAGLEAVPVHLLESFLRQLSHDVRNDLNAMELLVSYVEYEKSDGDVGSALKQLHDAIRYGARRMLRVSKAVQFPDVDHIPYPADIFLEDLRERVVAERPELALRIQWARSESREVAMVDAGLVLEALIELLDNAAAFSSSEISVQIKVESCDSGVKWSIFQHAAECPAGHDSWGRLPLVSTRRSHYGLGLFWVRRVLKAHRASLAFVYQSVEKKLVTEIVFATQA